MIFLIAIVVSFVTSIFGVIGFVGMIVPQIIRLFKINNNQLINIIEKPTLSSIVNIGFYVFSKKLINKIQNQKLDMTDLISKLLKEKFKNDLDNGAVGQYIYSSLASIFDDKTGKKTSLFLLENGIDGVKYPAESISRGATSDTARGFNYVVFDENAVSIEEVIKFQKDANKARGAMMITLDGQAVIYALTDPNVSTPLHELAHVFEHYLSDAEKATIQSWAKTKGWTTETSEKFARGFEKYLAEGKAPTPALQKIFDKFKQWLTDIYNGITESEIDIELNDAMRDIYAQMLGTDVIKQTAKPEAVSKEGKTNKQNNEKINQNQQVRKKPDGQERGQEGNLENAKAPDEKNGQEKVNGENKLNPIERKSAAEKVRKAKIKPNGKAFDATIGLPIAVWNGAVETVATAIEAGVAVADAIKRGLNYIQKNHRGAWNKKEYNTRIIEELGFRGITVNGEDLIVKPIVDKQTAEIINGFYSPLEQGVLDSKTEKTTGREWLKKIQSVTEKDELVYTGIKDFLESNSDKQLTKADILDYLKNNRVQLVEVVKKGYKEGGLNDEWTPGLDYNGDRVWKNNGWKVVELSKDNDYAIVKPDGSELDGSWGTRDGAMERVRMEEPNGTTKFSQHQLEGEKSNYKEVLVTLPRKDRKSTRLNSSHIPLSRMPSSA